MRQAGKKKASAVKTLAWESNINALPHGPADQVKSLFPDLPFPYPEVIGMPALYDYYEMHYIYMCVK